MATVTCSFLTAAADVAVLSVFKASKLRLNYSHEAADLHTAPCWRTQSSTLRLRRNSSLLITVSSAIFLPVRSVQPPSFIILFYIIFYFIIVIDICLSLYLNKRNHLISSEDGIRFTGIRFLSAALKDFIINFVIYYYYYY